MEEKQNIPISLETLWKWHDMAEEVRDLCRSRESLVAERAEQLRTEVDMFVLRNTPHQPPASCGLDGCDGSQSDQHQQKD